MPVYQLWALLVSLGGACAAFGAAKKICPPRVVEHEVPFHTGVDDVDAMLTGMQKQLDTLHALNEALPDPNLSAAMTRMEKAGRSIVETVEASPAKAKQVRRFANYYLPDAVNVLQQYARLARQGVKGENAASIRAEVEHNAASIATAFENQLDALYAAESMDLSADLTVLQNMLKGHDDYRHRSSLPAYFGTLGYVSLSGYGTRFGSDTDAVASKGLETGCLYAMLPDIETLLGANYYYDDKNRIIQRRMQTMHGGLYAEDIAYNFTGNILSRRESCQPQPDAATDVLINSYTYDDRGRLLSETASLNRTAVAPYSCSYDDFGRLVSTTQGSGSHAVTTTRQYNIRNWLTSQQNSLFEMSLAYNTPQYSEQHQAFFNSCLMRLMLR